MYSKRMNDSGKKVGEHALDYHETIKKNYNFFLL